MYQEMMSLCKGGNFLNGNYFLGGVVFDHMKDFGFLGHSNLDGVSGANSSKMDSTFLTSSNQKSVRHIYLHLSPSQVIYQPF
jgi:hypothetical protein